MFDFGGYSFDGFYFDEFEFVELEVDGVVWELVELLFWDCWEVEEEFFD